MSRILMCFYQPIMENGVKNLFCFYDSLSREFLKAGNEVLILNLAFFKPDYFSSKVINKKYLINQIKQFEPDLVIAFNNQIFDGLLENVDCPIAVWDADSIDLFSCKQLLKDNIDRFTMITSCKFWVDTYIDLGFKKDEIHYIPVATSVSKEDMVQNKNISFIGTSFGHSFKIYDNYLKYNNKRAFYDLYKKFLDSKCYDYKALAQELQIDGIEELTQEDFHLICDIRPITLTNLLDLDLHLYGLRWHTYKGVIPQLHLAYDPTPVYSLDHNQNIYNSSKIGLSINHPQNQGNAFPWRIFDVMASNACLVSSYSQQLVDETKGVVEIPMFHNQHDARDICKKILAEDNYREDLVLASQQYVEKNARWKYRFETLEDIFNLKINNDLRIGQAAFLQANLEEDDDQLSSNMDESSTERKFVDIVHTEIKEKPVPEIRREVFHLKTKLFRGLKLNLSIRRDIDVHKGRTNE